jgi:general secretion pathway protein K
MKKRKQSSERQRGAALLIVLLLAATLSFIILGLADAMQQAVRLNAGAGARGALLWRATSLETLAKEAVAEALRLDETDVGPFTLEHPLFATEFQLPADDGGGAMRFADATRCFNLNSLVIEDGQNNSVNESAVNELAAIAEAIGMGVSDAMQLAHVAADWVDSDNVQEIRGAEDGLYTILPTPFRTGAAKLAAVSEIRAMDGVTAQIYAAIEPYLCAHPSSEPSLININMLRPQDAPILVGLTEGAVSRLGALEVIADKPPGGWDDIDAFWSHRVFVAAEDIDVETLKQRTALSSRYIEVLGRASVNDVEASVRLLFMVEREGEKLLLLSREIGAPS